MSNLSVKQTNLRSSRRRKGFMASRDIPHYLLLLPAFAILLVFSYGPMYGIVMAFQKFSPYLGVTGSKFVGLTHFKFFLTDHSFWRVMRNTVIINFYQLIFSMLVPIIFASSLNEVRLSIFKRTVQTISYLPHFISGRRRQYREVHTRRKAAWSTSSPMFSV